jgi:hypothetical protein
MVTGMLSAKTELGKVAAKVATARMVVFIVGFVCGNDFLAERIHVSSGFGAGDIRFKIWRLGPVILGCVNNHCHNFPTPNPKDRPIKTLALDLGKFNTMCCFFDSKTRKHTFLNATTDRGYLAKVFIKHKLDLVVMVACGPSGWINDLAASQGLKTLVCSTNEDACL